MDNEQGGYFNDEDIDYITSQHNFDNINPFQLQDGIDHPLFTQDVQFREHMNLNHTPQGHESYGFDSFEVVNPYKCQDPKHLQAEPMSELIIGAPMIEMIDESSSCATQYFPTTNATASPTSSAVLHASMTTISSHVSNQRLSVKEKAMHRKKAIEKRQPPIVIPAAPVEEEEDFEEMDKKKQQKIKNRISAQRSRDSKKIEFSDLRQQVSSLTLRVEQLTSEKEQLQFQLKEAQRGICQRCLSSESTTDAISDFSSEEVYEYTRQPASTKMNHSMFTITPMKVMIIVGLIMAMGFGTLQSNGDVGAIQPLGVDNYLMLNQVSRNDRIEGQLDQPHIVTEDEIGIKGSNYLVNTTMSEEEAAIFAKLIAQNGINPNALNYDTKIMDSRAKAQKGLLALIGDNGEMDTPKQSQQFCSQNMAIEPKQKNDQIYCADPMIFLNNLSPEKLSGKQEIDLVYMSSNAKSFIQFGDQYFQTKGEVADTYVQLTCQVVNYYSREI